MRRFGHGEQGDGGLLQSGDAALLQQRVSVRADLSGNGHVREIIEKVARHALIIELAAHSKLVQESEAARLVNQRELCVWYINVSYRG